MSKYISDPGVQTRFIYEATFIRPFSSGGVEIRTKYIAQVAQEVVDYLEEQGSCVRAIRNIGFANLIG